MGALFLLGTVIVLLYIMVLGAAPSPTARVDPTGLRLTDGHPTKVTFALDTNIELWEMEVTPFGLDGGDEIDTTTMHNDTVRTKAPRALIDVTNASFMCAYDPTALTACLSAVNRKDTITVTYPDGSTDAVFGFMKSFVRDAVKEGEMPTATVEIVATNYDSSGAEQVPVVAGVAGT